MLDLCSVKYDYNGKFNNREKKMTDTKKQFHTVAGNDFNKSKSTYIIRTNGYNSKIYCLYYNYPHWSGYTNENGNFVGRVEWKQAYCRNLSRDLEKAKAKFHELYSDHDVNLIVCKADKLNDYTETGIDWDEVEREKAIRLAKQMKREMVWAECKLIRSLKWSVRKGFNNIQSLRSEFVGNVGDKIEVTAKILSKMHFDTDWGSSTLTTLVDDNGNVFTNFSGSAPFYLSDSKNKSPFKGMDYVCEEGDTVKFSAKIKSHKPYQPKDKNFTINQTNVYFVKNAELVKMGVERDQYQWSKWKDEERKKEEYRTAQYNRWLKTSNARWS